jgi:hypothetical protein
MLWRGYLVVFEENVKAASEEREATSGVYTTKRSEGKRRRPPLVFRSFVAGHAT